MCDYIIELSVTRTWCIISKISGWRGSRKRFTSRQCRWRGRASGEGIAIRNTSKSLSASTCICSEASFTGHGRHFYQATQFPAAVISIAAVTVLWIRWKTPPLPCSGFPACEMDFQCSERVRFLKRSRNNSRKRFSEGPWFTPGLPSSVPSAFLID